MKKYKLGLLSAFAFVQLNACVKNKVERHTFIEGKITDFRSNRKSWNHLTQQVISSIPKAKGYYQFKVSKNDLSKELNKSLEEKGVHPIYITYVGNCQEISYSTNWGDFSDGQINLIWSTCADSVSTYYGYYDEHEFIEVWGLGESWLLVCDLDLI